MKNIFLLFALIFSANLTFGQVSSSEVKKIAWNSNDKDFNKTEIPEKWKNESAVIICLDTKAEYDKFGLSGMSSTKLRFTEFFHKRIKLLDKAAIETYSEFSFADELGENRGRYTKSSTLHYGLKIIKADGKEKIIDLKNAVDVEGDGNQNVKKIPIPDLEEGDILDYYFYTEEEFVSSKSYGFMPTISTLNASYSIMKQKFEFVVEKNFYINFKSVNGAPNLKVREDEENKKIIYSLVDEDRPKLKYPMWVYRYREYPTIKFQVIYTRKNAKDGLFSFLGESGIAKNNVSQDEILDFAKEHYNDMSSEAKLSVKQTLAYLKRVGIGKNATPEKKLEWSYYYLRHILYVQAIENSMIRGSDVGVGQMHFAQIIGALLDKWKVSYDLIIAADKNYTGLEDLLFYNESTVVIKANFKKPAYITNVGMHTRYNELPAIIENAEAYSIDIANSKASIKKIKMPSSNYKENQQKSVANITFNKDDITILEIKRRNEYLGLSKLGYQSSMLQLLDFLVDDASRYFTKSIFQPDYFYYAADKQKMKELTKEREEKEKEAQEEAVKATVIDDYDFTELKDFEGYDIFEKGRDRTEDKLITRERFTMDGFVKKAGQNYILEAGKLIGGQVEVEEEDRKRTQDIYMPYARSFNYEMIITIPNGYDVQGMDKFEYKVENETGGFVSSAVIDGDKIRILSYKYYKHNVEKTENWEQMQVFLDAALDFTQQKLLLKKMK